MNIHKKLKNVDFLLQNFLFLRNRSNKILQVYISERKALIAWNVGNGA